MKTAAARVGLKRGGVRGTRGAGRWRKGKEAGRRKTRTRNDGGKEMVENASEEKKRGEGTR